RPGATGAVSVQWVVNQPADGYNVLYGAENPQVYKVLEISPLDYGNFYPVNILARGVGVVICNNNMPWKTMKELFDEAKKTPGQVKLGSTGPGGLPHVVSTMFRAIDGVTFNAIPFDGEGPAMTALQGGHVQFMVAGLTAAREHIRAGRVRALAVISDTPIPGLEQIPLITATNPGYKKFLPWGPYYGVFVRKETPDDVKKKLVEAFQKGAGEEKFQSFIRDFGAIYMGIAGDEAEKFIRHSQSVTTWMLQEAGATKASPEKFGIPKP
ncbi:MAG: tripartite tricarboxylate transporter substrate binding protein, partial [Smithellaceae bacterium]|nr:tripartite tricarboxylate transporter substrate binding protein [Smithellaceae bacterium]